MFSRDVSQRIIGVTPRYSDLDDIQESLVAYERDAECVAWLRQNGRSGQNWLALDDRSWLFRPFNPHVFLVNGKVGLDVSAATSLLTRLQN